MTLAVSIGAESIGIYKDGDFFQVDNTHPNYEAVLAELRKTPRDVDVLMALVDLPTFYPKITAGKVEVSDDQIYYNGEPISGYMVERTLSLMRSGHEIDSWAAFMDHLMDNPTDEVRKDLFQWVEAGRMPITPDGCLIGFKKVRANYMDVHSGRFSNTPGSILDMDRDACDKSRNNTCSTGFHFCSPGYLSHFSGERVMVVKINPRDVTAIPADYNNHKARCCHYEVLHELSSESAVKNNVWAKNVLDVEDPSELPEGVIKRVVETKKPAGVTGKPVEEIKPDAASVKDKDADKTAKPGARSKSTGVTKKPASKAKPSKAKKLAKPKAKAVVAMKPAAKTKTKKPKAEIITAQEVPDYIAKPRSKRKSKTEKPASVPKTATKTKKLVKTIKLSAASPTVAPKGVPVTSSEFKAKGVTYSDKQIREAMKTGNSSHTAAAKILGVPRSTLGGWWKKLVG